MEEKRKEKIRGLVICSKELRTEENTTQRKKVSAWTTN